MTRRAARRRAEVASVFGTTLTKLSEREGMQVTVRVRRSGSFGGAKANPVTRTITVPPSLFDAPTDGQAWTAAHELAHIVLYPQEAADEDSQAEVQRMSALLALTVGGVLAAGALAVVGAFVPVPRWPVPLLLASTLVIFVTACRAFAAWRLPREVAADRLAARWGYPVTASIADQLVALEPWFSRHRLYRPLRTHPHPSARITSSAAIDSDRTERAA